MFFDIILLLIIVGFLVYKLGSALGKNDSSGTQRSHKFFFPKKAKTDNQASYLSYSSEPKKTFLKNPLVSLIKRKPFKTQKTDQQSNHPDQLQSQEKLSVDQKLLLENIKQIPPQFEAVCSEVMKVIPDIDLQKILEATKQFFEDVFHFGKNGSLSSISHFMTSEIYQKISSHFSDKLVHNYLYKINTASITSLSKTNSAIDIEICVNSLQISYKESESGDVIFGSKSKPIEVSDSILISKNFLEKNSGWVLKNIY